jgi:hypothetical protein
MKAANILICRNPAFGCRRSPGGRVGGFKRSAQRLGESRGFSMS